MLTSGLSKKSKLIDCHSTEDNMAQGKHYIEYSSKSIENKGYIKPKVVIWKCYTGFLIWVYIEKPRTQGRVANSNQPNLIAFPKIGNDVSALVTIIVIAQCQMKNTRSIRLKP